MLSVRQSHFGFRKVWFCSNNLIVSRSPRINGISKWGRWIHCIIFAAGKGRCWDRRGGLTLPSNFLLNAIANYWTFKELYASRLNLIWFLRNHALAVVEDFATTYHQIQKLHVAICTSFLQSGRRNLMMACLMAEGFCSPPWPLCIHSWVPSL